MGKWAPCFGCYHCGETKLTVPELLKHQCLQSAQNSDQTACQVFHAEKKEDKSHYPIPCTEMGGSVLVPRVTISFEKEQLPTHVDTIKNGHTRVIDSSKDIMERAYDDQGCNKKPSNTNLENDAATFSTSSGKRKSCSQRRNPNSHKDHLAVQENSTNFLLDDSMKKTSAYHPTDFFNTERMHDTVFHNKQKKFQQVDALPNTGEEEHAPTMLKFVYHHDHTNKCKTQYTSK